MMKSLTSDFLARITQTLISSFAVTGYFQNVDFQGVDLVILNFDLPYCMRYVSYSKNRLFYVEIIVF